MDSANADATAEIEVRVCATKACTATASTQYGAVLIEADATVCGEGGQIGLADGVNLGGQWVYVELTTDLDDNDKAIVWVVGQ